MGGRVEGGWVVGLKVGDRVECGWYGRIEGGWVVGLRVVDRVEGGWVVGLRVGGW